MSYDRNSVRAEIAAATAAATGPADQAQVEIVPIYTTAMVRDLLARDPRTLFMIMGKYAPKGTEGYVYTVAKVNKTTVDLVPLGGGRQMRADASLLVLPSPDEVLLYDKARAATAGTEDVTTGSVVRLDGPRWPHRDRPESLWVVTARKGMTEMSVAPLCGGGDQIYPSVPVSYVTAMILPQGLAAALLDDKRFA